MRRMAVAICLSGVPIRVLPLDATNRVKMDLAFVANFKRVDKGPLAEVINNLLDRAHDRYAWDALPAADLVDPGVAGWTPTHLARRGINYQGTIPPVS